MKKILFLLLLQWGLSGCELILISALNNDSSERTYDTDQEARFTFENSSVECQNYNCPASAAALYLLSKQTPRKLGACSGTLIGKNLVLTNAHCIPDGIQYRGANCEGQIKINFPQSQGYPRERVECSHIVNMATDPTGDDQDAVTQPDWAVIQLQRDMSRPHVQVSTAGIPDFSTITVPKVDFNLYSGQVASAKIKVATCKGNTTRHGSIYNIGAVSMLFTASDCNFDMIKGNSGSGVINSAGKLVGVFSFAPTGHDSDDDDVKEWHKKYPNDRPNWGGGTNIACVPVLPGHKVNQGLCQFESKTYKDLAYQYSRLRILEESKKSDQAAKSLFESMYATLEGDGVQLTSSVDILYPRFNLKLTGGASDPLTEVVFKKLIAARFAELPECAPEGMTTQEYQLPYYYGSNLTMSETSFYYTYQVTVESKVMVFKWLPSRRAYIFEPSFQSDSLIENYVLEDMNIFSRRLTIDVPVCP